MYMYHNNLFILERIGNTVSSGAVFSIDLTSDSKYLVTASLNGKNYFILQFIRNSLFFNKK